MSLIHANNYLPVPMYATNAYMDLQNFRLR